MRLSKLLGLAWLALATMAVAAPAPREARAEVFNPETFTLANGMQVVVVTNRRAPVVVHMVWYRVGAADDPPGKSGIAHFLEHLMFKGTKTVPGGQFSDIVARNGGNENAFTTSDYTVYFQKVARDRLELVMRLEADRMVNLTLTDDDVLPERDVVLEERRSRTENNPAALLSEQVAAVQYLVHHYRVPIIGWREEVEKLTRSDAMSFYRAHYAPDNAVLVVAGDIDAKELRPLAEKYYGVIPARGIAPRQRLKEPAQVAARRVTLKDPRVRQPQWSRGYLAPSLGSGAGARAYALEVLAELFGGSTTSRLYRTLVVDQKIAVSAGAWYDDTSLDTTRFGLYATPSPGVAIDKVEAAMEAELRRLLADGVDAAEVARVKKRMIASAIYARESLFGAARAFGAALTSGETVADVEDWPDRIAAVTADDVIAAARAVLRPEASVTGRLLPGETS